jgi:hypothetical protein
MHVPLHYVHSAVDSHVTFQTSLIIIISITSPSKDCHVTLTIPNTTDGIVYTDARSVSAYNTYLYVYYVV